MKKRILLILAFFITILIGLTGWKIYDNNEAETEIEKEPEIVTTSKPQKIYTVADIFKDADFSAEETTLSIQLTPGESDKIFIENKEQRNQIINELVNLKLQLSPNLYPFTEASLIKVTLMDKRYSMFLYEKENNIFFINAENTNAYHITDGEKLYKLLNESIKN